MWADASLETAWSNMKWISFLSQVFALFSPALSWKWCPSTFWPSHCSCILSSLRSDLSSPSEWFLLCLVFRCYPWSQNHSGAWEKWEPEIGNCSFSWFMGSRKLGREDWAKIALITVALITTRMAPSTERNDLWQNGKADQGWPFLLLLFMASPVQGLLTSPPHP